MGNFVILYITLLEKLKTVNKFWNGILSLGHLYVIDLYVFKKQSSLSKFWFLKTNSRDLSSSDVALICSSANVAYRPTTTLC